MKMSVLFEMVNKAHYDCAWTMAPEKGGVQQLAYIDMDSVRLFCVHNGNAEQVLNIDCTCEEDAMLKLYGIFLDYREYSVQGFITHCFIEYMGVAE